MYAAKLASQKRMTVGESRIKAPFGAPGRRSATFERVIAMIALFLTGLRSPWHMGLTSGEAMALVLLPLTLPSITFFRWSKTMLFIVILCLASGSYIASLSVSSHVMDSQSRLHSITLVVGIAAAAVLVLWARRMLPPGLIAICFGLGGALGVGQYANFAESWKYGYSISVTLIVLGWATMQRSRSLPLVALGVLGAITLFGDARSLFAIYVVTAGLLVWSNMCTSQARRRAPVTRAALVLTLLFMVYKVSDILIMQGALGDKAKQRSIDNVAASGSTLLGGRPELSSTVALMRDNISGYGPGIIPNTHDVAVGNAALVHLGLQPTADGFSTFMFGRNQYELHSVFGDLWANFGIMGLIAAAALAILVVGMLSSAASARPVGALVLFLGCETGWNLVSSPLWSAEPTLILFLGLALPATKPIQMILTSPAHWVRFGRTADKQLP